LSYTIGVDTGGTFTDVVAIAGNGRIYAGKSATTPADLAQGVLGALRATAAIAGTTIDELLADTRIFRFSGTTAVNTLLTRSGANVGLITTSGFGDILSIGRAISAWAGLSEEDVRHTFARTKPDPIVPKHMIREVTERVDATGEVVVPLAADEVRGAVAELVEAGAESIAVCLLWSVRNPAHELAARELIAEAFPDRYVTISHEVAPIVGEYERFITTAIDAYVGPRLRGFLDRLDESLRANGFRGQLLVAQSDGGALYANETQPVYTVQSGPAGGVIASRSEGEALGFPNIITADIGGTSFDVGLVANGAWMTATSPVVDRFHVGFPMIEVESIGAGGGSIAWIDEGGALQVGPRSAGARPGPVCYDQGGTEPTVTDASVFLGYVDPDYFLGGEITLRADLAAAAIEKLAQRLELSPIRTAAGILEIAQAHMGSLVGRRVLARGYDPREFVLFAFGGAGGLLSAFYAEDLGVDHVVFPSVAATFSALGVATAPILHSARVHDFSPMPMDTGRFNAHLRDLRARVEARLDHDQVPESDRSVEFALEMRYGVQVHTVRLPIPSKEYGDADIGELSSSFDAMYERLYGTGSGYVDAGRFVTTFIGEGYGRLPSPDRAASATNGASAPAKRRSAFFDGDFRDIDVHHYDALRVDAPITGPTVIEAPFTTIVVPSRFAARRDEYGNIHLTPAAAAAEEATR
jgi:N-methylhydantoinase A